MPEYARILLSVAMAFAVVTGMAACGSASAPSTQDATDNSLGSSKSTPAAKAEWASAADSICESYEQRTAAAFKKVESDSTTRKSLSEVAKVLRKTAGLSTEMSMKLRELQRPPAVANDIEQYLAQLATAPRLDDSLADDLDHREIRKAEREFKALEGHALKARLFARRIGLKNCEESSDHRSAGPSLF